MIKLTRESFIPKDVEPIRLPHINAEIYFEERNGKYLAKGFSGKRAKPDFYYNFRTSEQREKYLAEYIKRLESIQKYKEEQKAKRQTFQHTLKIGDILECSWGYEQTNVDFYQVLEVKGKMVKIREIKSSMPNGETGFMTGHVIPLKDQFIEKEPEMLKRVGEGNSVSIESYASASPWDGLPCRVSWYG
jgi:hypothetical protein